MGAAASLLNDSPVTAAKVAEAETQLRGLLADPAADEPAICARYLLARIAHLHRPAEIAEIEAAYRAVIAAAPAHPLAQLAAGKLAVLLLYQRPELTVAQRLAAAAELAPVAGAEQLPETACVYYRVLAQAVIWIPYMLTAVLMGSPNSPLAITLSMIPLTAPIISPMPAKGESCRICAAASSCSGSRK